MEKIIRKTRSTIKDIAKYADVSPTAVSIVLRDIKTRRVSSQKRIDILKAAKNLNYRPNRIARALVAKESSTIGLLLNDLNIPFHAEIAQYIIAEAKGLGYSVFVSSLEPRSNNQNKIDEERQIIFNLIDRGVDGLIICSALKEDPVITELEEVGVPFVLALREVRRATKDSTLDYVGIDNTRGAYLLAEHLLKMGHRKIAIVTGDIEATSSHDRLSGTLEAFKDYHVDTDPELILNGEYKRMVSYRSIQEMLKKGEKPTAIISHSDHMAMGVLEALRDANIKVPKEVAVVGFDDSEMAGLPGIDLTTISQDKAALGKVTVDRLIEKIRNPSNYLAKRIILNPVLVIRKTSGFYNRKK